MARAIVAESGDGRTPLVAKIERPAAVDNLDAILGAADAVMVARGDLGLEMPFERVPRGPEGDHAARAPPRPAGDRRDAGLRLDAHRAAADPRRGERRRQRRRRRRRRDHADRRDRRRHRSDAHRADARRGDPRRRVADAVARDRSRPRGHRRPAQPRAVPVGGDAGGERARRRHRRGDARRQDRAHAVRLPPRASASSRSRRTPPIARRFAIYRGVLPLVAEIDPTGLAIERQLRERNLLPAGSVVVFLSVNADLTRSGRELPPHPPDLTRWWPLATNASVELARPRKPPGGPPVPRGRDPYAWTAIVPRSMFPASRSPREAIMAPMRPPPASSRDHTGPPGRQSVT